MVVSVTNQRLPHPMPHESDLALIHVIAIRWENKNALLEMSATDRMHNRPEHQASSHHSVSVLEGQARTVNSDTSRYNLAIIRVVTEPKLEHRTRCEPHINRQHHEAINNGYFRMLTTRMVGSDEINQSALGLVI